MYIVDNYFVAVIFCIVTMLCWGSWANTQKLASEKWPFQLFYWDYSIGIVVLTLLLALTLGSFGSEGRSFLVDLKQAQMENIGSALLGGIIFNFANLLLVMAIAISGMAIAFPIGIGLALVIGVITNYLIAPSGNPVLLFGGVLLIVGAILLDAIVYKKISTHNRSTMVRGVVLSLLAGIAMGFFYKYVAQSMTTNFQTPELGRLTPYSALFIFALGVLASGFVFNSFNMYFPLVGQKCSYRDYFKMGTPRLHLVGFLGGVIWGIGMSFSILASEKAGPAIAYGLGQGATMVAAVWGVFVWKEFKGASRQVNYLIATMFFLFILGLGLIIASK